jgi:integral membrane sensor domain MASE1
LTQAVITLKASAAPDRVSASLKRAAVVAAQLGVLSVGYYVAARLGLAFRFQNSPISVVWPANAVFMTALLLTSRARWWQVILVASLAHVAAMAPVTPGWRLAWQIGANALFTTATAELLRRFAGLPLHFGSRRQVAVYSAIVLVMPAFHAFIAPSFVRAALGLDITARPPVALIRAMLSNSTALLLIAPVLLLWAQGRYRRLSELSARRVFEAALIMSSLLVIGIAAFG